MSVTRFSVLILVTISFKYCSGGLFYIGAIFDRNVKLNSAILKCAVERANTQILADSDIELGYQTESIAYGNEFDAAQTVCDLLKGQANAIFAPKSPSASAHIASICDVKEIPYIDTYMDMEAKTSTVNFYPSQTTLSQLLIEVVNKYEWTDFTIIYEAPLYVKRIAPLLEDRNNKPGVVTVQPVEVGTNFRVVLQNIKAMEDRSKNIIIESSIEHLAEILDQALQVGLFTPDRSFIITNLDAPTMDLERFKYTQANITLFRLIDYDAPLKIEEFKKIKDVLEETRILCERGFNEGECTEEEIEELDPDYLQISTALIYDATMTLAEALKQIGFKHLQIGNGYEIDCYNSQSSWSKGITITNFMKNEIHNYSGLTGQVEFDTRGVRSNVEIDVITLTSDGLNKTGTYKPTNTEPLTFITTDDENNNSDELPINQKTFIVIIALVDPYIMLKDTSTGLVGNDRYEGFGIDIIDALSQMYGFKYIFMEQIDKDYGKLLDNNTGEWSGMIGKVRNGEADLAIADLTINSDRIEALDFTPSFMNLGIALLYRKPMKEPPSTFSFMAPFSPDVWFYLGAAYVIVSLCFFCLGRVSASQWENRYPCVEEPTFLENQFTLNNSMWFAAGALLQQGSEIEPKAASIRLASSFWWFFTLIMVSSYTANLAMFLVIENKTPKITSVADLKGCGTEGGECPITFGAKEGGATFTFFKESANEIYRSMYRYMIDNPKMMTKSNEEGVERAFKGEEDYAFLMESKSIEYQTERLCNLTQIGKALDDKNYGIGMRKGFKYAAQFSEGMLQLQESGTLNTLYKKWWKERKGGGACSKEDSSEAVALEFENLKGVFLVLLYGTIFACVYGYSAAFYLVYRRAKQQKISFKEELMAEVKFLMSCQGIKPVRNRKGSKSQYSGTSSRYSGGTNSQIHGSNQQIHG